MQRPAGAPRTDRPEPTATGVLEQRPLAHLLVYTSERRSTGSLELTGPDGVVGQVLLGGGRPSKVRTAHPVAYLGQILYERGLIDAVQLNASLARVASRRVLQGRDLVEVGAVSEDDLAAALAEQTERKLHHLLGLPPSTAFAFYEGTDLLAGFGGPRGTPVDPYPVLWRGTRDNPPQLHLRALLSRADKVPFHVAPGATIPRFRFDAPEAALVDCLRARPLDLSAFVALGLVPPAVAEALFYVLLITRQIERHDGATGHAATGVSSIPPRVVSYAPTSMAPGPATRSGSFVGPVAGVLGGARTDSVPPPGTSYGPRAPASSTPMRAAAPASVAPPSMAPPSMAPPSAPPMSGPQARGTNALPPPRYNPSGELELSPALLARREEIRARAEAIVGEDFFAMLGLGRDATADDARAAYFRLARQWHPDRIPAPLDDLREECAAIFNHLSEAQNVLGDDLRRERYLARLAEDRSPAARVSGTATFYEGAEVCASRKDYERAEALCRRYLVDHPNHAPSLALLALVLSLQPARDTAEGRKEQMRLLDRALTVDWENERAYFYRAQLSRRLHDEKSAVADFRAAAALNPHNIEAAREVRLHDMRVRNTPRSTASVDSLADSGPNAAAVALGIASSRHAPTTRAPAPASSVPPSSDAAPPATKRSSGPPPLLAGLLDKLKRR